MRIAVVLLVLAVAPAVAQPAPGAVLDAWRDGWRRASAGVDAVEMREETEWTVDGPRGRSLVEAWGRVRLGSGPPEREVDRVRVDGQDADPERGRGQGRRWQRAFGPAGREVHAPPRLPGDVLRNARGLGIAADRLGGEPAWRVDLDTRADRAEAWFTRSETPRLLAMRLVGRRPRGGRIEREVRYVRVAGLDLPARAQTTFTARQRRRLREYFVTLTAVGTYSGHTLR
ncbi:hypothetical protein [Rubrivirga sp.]|uniref:hypothetical protein n=1 Tax=Rubrivirga sp. TaxID=1885344 RepID=UPI003B52A502